MCLQHHAQMCPHRSPPPRMHPDHKSLLHRRGLACLSAQGSPGTTGSTPGGSGAWRPQLDQNPSIDGSMEAPWGLRAPAGGPPWSSPPGDLSP